MPVFADASAEDVPPAPLSGRQMTREDGSAAGRQMTVEELIDGWEAAWSSKDPDAFEPLCAPDLHYEDPLTGEPLEGVEQLSAHAERLWAGFPDARLERTGERLSNRKFVAAPSKLLGTHKEQLEGLPATNRFVVVHCIFYCELQRGRLLEGARLLRSL